MSKTEICPGCQIESRGGKSRVNLHTCDPETVEDINRQIKLAEACMNKDNSWEKLMNDFLKLSLFTFKFATVGSGVVKLQEEIYELAKAIDARPRNRDQMAEEYVDCLMCIIDSSTRAGISNADLRRAFAKKLQINKERKWVCNDDLTYTHEK